MPSQRPHPSQATSSSRRPAPSVRRNLFHSSLSRRPTTGSSTSTSAETLRLDRLNDDHENQGEQEDEISSTSDIVIRDRNGDFDVGEVLEARMIMGEEGEEEGGGGGRDDFEEKERQRLADAVKLHCRDRNRAPSEPVELLEAVRTSLRAKMAAMSEDNWRYEAGS